MATYKLGGHQPDTKSLSCWHRFKNDTELNQSIVRLLIPFSCVMYVHVILQFDLGTVFASPREFYIIYSAYIAVSLLICVWIYLVPGTKPTRRMIAMCADYVSMAYFIAEGKEVGLLVFAAMMSTTLGYGIRFGVVYLRIAICFVIGSLTTIYYVNQYWWEHPFFAATLSVTLLLVPLYVSELLKQLRHAVQMSGEAVEQKSNFLASAAHDIRHFVHVIGLNSARLKRTELTAEQLSLVGDVENSVRNANEFFQSLLDMSILERGGLSTKLKLVSVNETFREIRSANEIAADINNVTLKFVDTSAQVLTDPILLRTILQNLTSNAIKFSRGKKVVIGCRCKNGATYIHVSDQGVGISSDELENVYEEFYRAPSNGIHLAPGSGLGLAIVKRLVEQLDIEIEINSEEGQGTSFTLGPFDRAEPIELDFSASHQTSPQPLSGLKIFLVEDDLESLRALKAFLEYWGCKVDGDTKFPTGIPDCDIIISDFDLGDGSTLALHMKQVQQLLDQGSSVIVLTGHSSDDVTDAINDSRITILSKPVRVRELRSFLSTKNLSLKDPSI